MDHELPPRLFACTHQIVVWFHFFRRTSGFQFSPHSFKLCLPLLAFSRRKSTFSSDCLRALDISERISFSSWSIEDSIVSFCLSLASTSTSYSCRITFYCTRCTLSVSLFTIWDIFAEKEILLVNCLISIINYHILKSTNQGSIDLYSACIMHMEKRKKPKVW